MIQSDYVSLRRAARVAGLAYLATFVIVVAANFGIHERLIVTGDAAATARLILAHETLFRVAVVSDVVYCGGVVVLIAALYVLLAHVDRLVALLAALWRFLFVLMWALMTIRCLEALRLLSGARYLQALEPERLQALARLYLSSRSDMYYGGVLYFALASTSVAYLLLKSGYVPRVLAQLGLAASAWCALCAVAYLVTPDFATVVNLWWFDTPMGLFELAVGALLLFRGLPLERAQRRADAPALSGLAIAERS